MTTTAAAVPPSQARRWLVLVWVALTVALAVTAADLPWRLAAQYARRIHPGWLLASIAANAAILPLWAAEWRLLIPTAFRVTFARMLEVVTVSAAVLNSVPFFAGEASAVALLITRGGLARGAALTVLALDQLMVGLAKLALIVAAALFMPIPAGLRAGVLGLAVAVMALLVVLLPLAHGWASLRDRLLLRPTRVRALMGRVVALGQHLDALRTLDRVWRVLALALAKKMAEVAAIVAMQVAFGLDPSLASALLVAAALAITTLVPVAPANLGVYEGTVYAMYRVVGVQPEVAIGIAIVQHLAFLLPPLACGYLALTLRQARSRRPIAG
jgi:glycosyltransferase 2 family protein